VCVKLAALGASVAVNFSSNEDAALEVVSLIEKAGGRAIALGFDVSDEAAVQAGLKRVLEEFGRVDILVNNAGVTSDGLLVRTSGEEWKKTIDINLSGAFYCAKAVAKPMMKARRGRIINISSVIGETGNPGQAAYSASKAGIFGLTKSLARELGSRNITVNAVTPGYISTDMTSELSEQQRTGIKEQIVLGRLGEPEDVAEVVAFFAAPAASYITGQVLGVNGGMHM
jgi:3-oxoacyl-[acyl-carrier protein] reductase